MTLLNAEVFNHLSESKTVAINDKARSLIEQGKDVINLGGGEPDFDTPHNIIDIAEEAMKKGKTHYVNSPGIPELREEIALKLRNVDNCNYHASQIIVTPGGKLALYIALMSMINPDDEVMIVNPAWVSYEPLITMVGGKTVYVNLDQKDNFTLKGQLIAEACTAKTKAIIINTPNNPTGRVLKQEEIAELRKVAEEHNLIVISDEVYDRLTYEDHQFISVASDPELLKRTITVQSFSKGYAMTGWRLGYLALPEELCSAALKAQQHMMTCTTSFVQIAGIAALKNSEEEVVKMKNRYEERLDFVVESLNKIPGVTCEKPEGAFYVFPEIDFAGFDSYQLAEYLLEEVGVAVTPGEAFGSAYKKNVRISCANSDEMLKEAMKRMAKAFS
ncbi:pyridoxal phosphate-dependent aminotransferase [Lysinibacillus sp. FSL H8-0500]|uniref:pyridoxal phosphate-dependent aminotransferase n=1 Tax=Lysinibacillus sp. FSL H8-0500 TaxID=2921393 RepID=UPI0031010D0F